jgi:menaquinol-cytochrome c reductase iron-sulfur subunit
MSVQMTPDLAQETTSPAPLEPASVPRRSFVWGIAAGLLAALSALPAVIAGAVFAIDPLVRRKPSLGGADADGYLPAVPLNQLPADGTPVRVALTADQWDAWNKFANRSIGAVYVRLVGESVIAFSDVCPHLGCKVELRGAEYHCPCHQASFTADGTPKNGIPPRGLDTLVTKVVEGQVWVKYEQFQTGRSNKVAVV